MAPGPPSAAVDGRAPRIGVYQRAAQWATEGSPWELVDFIRFIRLVGIGGVGLGICWYGMSGENDWHKQMPWIAGAAVSVLVAGAGILMWLLSGLRQVHYSALEVITQVSDGRLEQLAAIGSARVPAPDASPAATLASGDYVIGAGMTRVHRETCGLVRGKQVQPVTEDEFYARDLRLCGMCCL